MKYTVVVAEDEELLLNNLVQKIQKADPDFQVTGTAQTGEQAFALVEKLTPDLVITDIRMPVMDGMALLTKVRSQFPFTKFIITSGFSDFEYAKKAITLKVSDYLLKPVDPDELHDALQKIKHEFQIAKKDYEAVFNAGTASMTPSQIASVLRDFIIKNYSDDINLNLIADNMNYSPGYLTKIFCQAYDCTPTKYLTNLRMHHAQKLLLNEPFAFLSVRSERCAVTMTRDISAVSSRNIPARARWNIAMKKRKPSNDDFLIRNIFHTIKASLSFFYSQFTFLVIPDQFCGCVCTLLKVIVISLIFIKSKFCICSRVNHQFHRSFRFLRCISKSVCNRKNASCLLQRSASGRSAHLPLHTDRLHISCRSSNHTSQPPGGDNIPIFFTVKFCTFRAVVHWLCNCTDQK